MKAIPSQLREHLDTGATTMCYCWKVQRSDGVIMGFTEHDEDLVFAGVRFEAASGFTATQIEQSLGLAVDNQNMAGALSSNYITEKDIARGRFDGAIVELFWVNWSDPEQRLRVAAGTIGEVKRKLTTFEAEFRSNADALNAKVGRIYQKTCDADLGDTRCGFKFKDFAGRDANINIQQKFSDAWDALRLFDEPDITDSDYPIQLLPYVKDGGLEGIDMRFQWPVSGAYTMTYAYDAILGGAGIQVVAGDLGGYTGYIRVKKGKKKKTTYGYFGYRIEHYARPPNDVVYFLSSNIIYDYDGKRAAQVGRNEGWTNWYVLRSPEGTPVHTVVYGGTLGQAFSISSVSGWPTETAAVVRTTRTTPYNVNRQLQIAYTGPNVSSVTVGGLNASIANGVFTLNGQMSVKREFSYSDFAYTTSLGGAGFGYVFDVVFTLTNGTTAAGELAIGVLQNDGSPNYVYVTHGINRSGQAGSFDGTVWYDAANEGVAWTGNYQSNPAQQTVTQIIPNGSIDTPANYPVMMMGTVFGFDLTDRRRNRIYLYATTDAQYYIGSPGWHPPENNDNAGVQGNGQPRSTTLGSGTGSWTGSGWWQQSINPSRGPKMAELRRSPVGHWPDVTRYSDTFFMIEEAVTDFNEAIRLAVEWYKAGQPITSAALIANMQATANDSAALYLNFDLDIAQRTHTIPGSVPRTVVDYNAWIDANAIANGSATAATLPFLRVPQRRENLTAAIAQEIINTLGTFGITGATSTKAYDVVIVDQWIKGNTLPYGRSWTGPIRGRVLNVPNPLDYIARLFVVSDAVYLIDTVDLEADGAFYFSESGVGSKVISIRSRADDSILTEARPGIGLVRSYRIPRPQPHPTLVYNEASIGSQGLYRANISATVTAGGSGTTGYTLDYSQFQAQVASPALVGTAFSVSIQFTRLSATVAGLFQYYKCRVWKISQGTYTDYSISAAGQLTFTIDEWGPNVRMELYSRTPLEDDIVVYFALRDRCFVYDQGVALIAACIIGDQSWAERWLEGMLASLYISDQSVPGTPGVPTADPLLIGNVAFSVNRNSGVPPDDYVRTGATAWVGTALAYFCRTFPQSDLYGIAYARLFAMMDNLDTHYKILPGHPDYRKNGQPGFAGNDPNQYVLVPPLNGVTQNPVREDIPVQWKDNRYGLYAGGYGAYVQAYQAYAPTYRIPWVAAEHNIDMYFLLYDCYKVSGDEKWKTAAAEHYTRTMEVMWEEDQGRIIQGARSLSKDYWTALDQHSWGACMMMAGGDPDKARRAMSNWTPRFKWVLDEGQEGYSPYAEGVGLPTGEFSPYDETPSQGVNLYPDVGPDYPGAQRGVWPEGTFGVVLAQLALGQKRQGAETYARVSPLLNTFGYIYTTTPDLGYELQAWESVAGTGWAIIGADPKGFWEVYDDLLDIPENIFVDVVGPNSYIGTVTSTQGRFVYCTGTGAAQGQPGYYKTDHFTGGLFSIKSGELDGYKGEIKRHWSDGTTLAIELWTLPPKGPLLGEKFAVRAGCDKRAKTCKVKFDNFTNFQGFPFMPGNDTFGQYPNKDDPQMDGGSINIGWDT